MKTRLTRALLSIGILLLLEVPSNAQILTGGITGGGGGGGSLPTSPSFNSVNFNVANANGCINYGASVFSTLVSNALRVDCLTTTRQELAIVGTNTGTAGTSYLLQFTPPVATGDVGIISVNSGDGTDNNGLRLAALGQGQILLAVSNTDIVVMSGSAVPNGATGLNLRSDSMYGFSNTVSGPETDTVVAGLQYEGSALIKLNNGSTGYGTLDALGLKASGVAGASCTLTTVSHLTVVNGIVTLCN